MERFRALWETGTEIDDTTREKERPVKKVLGIVAIAFAVFFVLTQPHAAADVVRGAGGVVEGAFNSFIAFMTALLR